MIECMANSNIFMKKILILFVLFIAASALKAQNVQLHYDMDYGSGDVQGVSLGYFEIARGLKFWKSPFELHVEYNGGFGQFKATPYNGAYQINDAWLFGGNYTWNTADFSKVFTLQAMYKNIRGKNDMSFQLTGVWNLQFFKNKVTLSGFADFWREDNIVGVGENTKATEFVFLSEPQFWFNCTDHFSVGSEVELSSNFGGHDGFMVNPTIAAKWKF